MDTTSTPEVCHLLHRARYPELLERNFSSLGLGRGTRYCSAMGMLLVCFADGYCFDFLVWRRDDRRGQRPLDLIVRKEGKKV